VPAHPNAALEAVRSRLLARRPSWLDEPPLDAYDTVDSLLAAIRHCHDGCGTSDAVVRSLARVGETEPDAWTVLVYALVGMIWPRMGPEVSDAHKSEVVGEVTIVLLEALTLGDLDRCDALARRLVKRAHSRLQRDTLSDTTRGKQRQFTVASAPPDWLARAAHAGSLVEDRVGDAAAARVDLGHVVSTIHNAVASGDLPEKAWADYRDIRLARVLYEGLPAATVQQRSAVWRASTLVHARVVLGVGLVT
jgi:hypothetical protein